MKLAAAVLISDFGFPEESLLNHVDGYLKHLQDIGVDEIYIYYLRSHGKAFDAIKSCEIVKGIRVFDGFNITKTDIIRFTNKIVNKMYQYTKQVSGADWILCTTTFSRFLGTTNVVDIKSIIDDDYDGIILQQHEEFVSADKSLRYTPRLVLARNLPQTFVDDENTNLYGIENIKTVGNVIVALYLLWENFDKIDIVDIAASKSKSITTYKPFAPTITLSMIAKDEAECIGDLLESVKPILYEVVLEDTGSQDDTIKIVKRFCEDNSIPFKLSQEAWTNDFSYHRNKSLAMATGSWVLIMDPDEVFAVRDLWRLYHAAYTEKKLWQIVTYNYNMAIDFANRKPTPKEYEDMARGCSGYGPSIKGRFFPRSAKLTWKGVVHELLEYSARTQNLDYEVIPRLPIHHFGKVRNEQIMSDKKKRQEELGIEKVKSNPHNAQFRYELGLQYHENGDYEKAIEQFDICIGIDSNHAEAIYNRGVTHSYLGNNESSKRDFEKVIQIRPMNADAMNNIAVIYEREEKIDKAMEIYSKMMSLFPWHAGCHNNYGVCLVKTGRLPEAVKYYEKAVSIDKNPSHILNYLNALHRTNNIEKAVNVIKSHLDILKEIEESAQVIIMVIFASPMMSLELLEIASYFIKMCEHEPSFHKFYSAKIKQFMGDPEGAVSLFKELLEDSSLNEDARKLVEQEIWNLQATVGQSPHGGQQQQEE